MFPSAGLFSETDCPFLIWGECDRPYCPYRHHRDVEPGHGSHSTTSGSFNNQEKSQTCLLELERINQQIEAVRSEVEKEQKRLSRYQAESVGSSSEEYLKSSSTLSTDQNGNQLNCKKLNAFKYVVDRTKPKTDLEYDPCSNFSAALRSGNSTDEVKSAIKADIESEQREKETGSSVATGPVQLSFNSEESDDDRMLVIDIPPIENNNRSGRAQKQSTAAPIKMSTELPKNDDSTPLPTAICLTKNGLTSIRAQDCLIPVLHEKKDKAILSQSMVQKVQFPSEEVNIPEVQHSLANDDSNPSESMIEIDSLHVKEMFRKGLKQNVSPSKSDESKVEVTENDPKAQESTKSSLIAIISESSQVCQSESPGCEKQAQRVVNVPEDIYTCLDHLRRESESISCLEGVKNHNYIPSAPSSSNSDHLPLRHQVKVFAQTDHEIQHDTWLDSVDTQAKQKLDTLPFKHPQEPGAVQTGSSIRSSLPGISMDPEPAQAKLALIEASRASQQKSHVGIVLNSPGCSSGSNSIAVPFEQMLNNSGTTPILFTQDQSTCAQSVEADNEGIQINSSSSAEELNYSDLDISDSDPMEECYRIFMEAKNAEDPTLSNGLADDVSQSAEPDGAKPPPAQRKRVAHVARFEQASRNTAQVIVPLRDEGSQLPVPSRTQQCQKRASTLTAAAKGCQTFIAAATTRRVITPNAIHSTSVPNGCVNIIPAGATLQLGPNLHLIVPEGSCALPVTIIPATAAVIPARPLHPPAPASQPVQPVNYTPARAIPTKRKAKARPDSGVKVPHDVRQRYVNLFVEEFLKTSSTVQEAFEKALAEEKIVFDRSVNKLKYLSIAVNALKRLKNQNAAPAKFSSEKDVRASRGNVPLNTPALLGPGDAALYDQLTEHILSKALLKDNNYPYKHPSKAGFALQQYDTKKGVADGSRRICCRCGTSFSVSQSGTHTRKEECNYHYGKVIENRVPGGVETRYSCCENAVGSPGCQTFKLHVHDAVSLQGFVSSLPHTHPGCPGIYAIDTEMCYTTQGLELVRVTVVNSSLQVIYDMFVKPSNEVIDYNTRFSGISEDDVKNSSSSLHDVQAVLLSFISEGTILVGHCLETDLCAIKLLHSAAVDTSVVFPHRLGPPHKRDLRSLTAEYLRKIIQEDVEKHDTREDATACMELVLWKVKEDAKGKRW